MAGKSSGRIALMAIHPNFAEAILDGTKTVEFRKRAPASDIRTVLIYATSPVQAIVGSFEIGQIITSDPGSVWDAFGDAGVIGALDFDSYYKGSSAAVAITVGATERFERPVPLAELTPPPATPQKLQLLGRESRAGLATENREVTGSTPVGATTKTPASRGFQSLLALPTNPSVMACPHFAHIAVDDGFS